jgi:hypothetical protein
MYYLQPVTKKLGKDIYNLMSVKLESRNFDGISTNMLCVKLKTEVDEHLMDLLEFDKITALMSILGQNDDDDTEMPIEVTRADIDTCQF